jgi:hypothetical protein
VARGVEEVEGEPLVLEAHHRRGDRDAALALDRHPIRAHPPPLTPPRALNFARQLDRPAKQQQFLGQGRLAGVGMPNDRKAAPARKFVGRRTLESVLAVGGMWAVAGNRFRCAEFIVGKGRFFDVSTEKIS